MRAISILAVLLAVRAADAQPSQALPRAEDKAEADRLFEEGRELMAKGDRAEACKRFDLSLRKDPRAVGTMLNLGLCREEVGQIATAMRYYAEARDRARDQNLEEHQHAAERKLALLAPRVPHLLIQLPLGLPDNARILVDDLVVMREEAGDVTVDPGPHTVIVTAPGKLPFESRIDAKESERSVVKVAPLEGAKTVVVQNETPRRALWGKIMVAGGGVLLGAGVGLALYGRSRYWDEFPSGARDGLAVMDGTHDCWTTVDDGAIVRECNTRGRDATRSARTLSYVGVGTMIAGGAAAIGGVILWLTAPKTEPSPAVTFSVGADHATFALTRSF